MSDGPKDQEPSDRIGLEERRRPWRVVLIGGAVTLLGTLGVAAYSKHRAVLLWEDTLADADASGFFELEEPPRPGPGVETFDRWLVRVTETYETLGDFEGAKGETAEFEALRSELRRCDREGGMVMEIPVQTFGDEPTWLQPEWGIMCQKAFADRLMADPSEEQKLAAWKDCLRMVRGLSEGRLIELNLAASIVRQVIEDVEASGFSLDDEGRAMLGALDLKHSLENAYRREPIYRREFVVGALGMGDSTSIVYDWLGRDYRDSALLLRAGMDWREALHGPHPLYVLNQLREISTTLMERLEGGSLDVDMRVDQTYQTMQQLDPMIGRHQ